MVEQICMLNDVVGGGREVQKVGAIHISVADLC